jgi:hypothetical protein
MNYNLLRKSIFGLILVSAFSGIYAKSADTTIVKRVYMTAFAQTEPVIDGLDNDDSWNLVEWTGQFTQYQPQENKPPAQQTRFKVLYDNDNVYVFIRAFDTEPDKISRIMSRRDNFNGDMVIVDIDSYFDKQTDFLFSASASGAKGDAVISQDGQNEDDSWNPIWYLKTSIDDGGWNAEMKIPLSQLRFGKKDELIWGFQITRHLFRLQERSQWQYIPKGSPGIVHMYGELHGIKNLKPKRQVEIMPYAVAKTERSEKIEGDPFNTGKYNKLSAGLDGKVGITNDITLDFTVNPDFGQVEADPSEVNLTAFETYFSERRPFFVEGANIFQFTPNQSVVINNMYTDNLFYSRRIGRYPHNYPSVGSDEFVRMPESTSILGAMKISGKTKEGLSVGILESLTAREDALIDSLGSRRKETVEPLTNYLAGRVQQDFNKGTTTIGGMITAVNRDINSPVLDYLHTAAYTAGVDIQHSWKDRTWYIAGNAEYSNVKGKPQAITATQTSSARYFQRPDAKYLSVDSSLTTLAGYGSTVKFGRSSNKHLQFETSLTLRSPGLEFNDIGYMRYSDVIHHGTWVAYYERNPFFIFNNFHLNTNYWMYWDFSGRLLSTFLNTNFNSQFKNRWRINGNLTRQSENISTTLLRGGPSFTTPGQLEGNVNVSTDQTKKITFYLGTYAGFGDVNYFNGHSYWSGITIRPMNSLSVSLEPQYSVENNMLQYVTTAGSASDTRYVFAELSQETMLFTFRLNYTVNPELSLEYYGQPFISAGKYTSFKKITQPDAETFSQRFHVFTPGEITYDASTNQYFINEEDSSIDGYTVDNPDFNFSQFRSNLVVRWEYRPGSTLYFVWSQGRTGSGTDGNFSYRSDMKNLFGITPQNVFLLKFSYWFAL